MNYSYKLVLPLLLLLTGAGYHTKAQSCWKFGTKTDCGVNANASGSTDDNNYKRAVFMYRTSAGQCTGTMINRNTSQSGVGQYFITSWHCFKTGDNCTGNDIDFNSEVFSFYFNYQSPDGNTNNTPGSNRGCYNAASTSPGDQGFEYYFTSKVRLVDYVSCHNGEAGFLGGDFAICEIIDPIPPHFNIYYAGWSPNGLVNKNVEAPFHNLSHPIGDIKKRAYAPYIQENVLKIIDGCRLITKIIDVLFGWIWGHRWSTEVICNYIDIPYYYAIYSSGCTDHGSSGSTLVNGNYNIVGTLSGFGNFYAKFPNNYLFQGVKNALNPPNSWSVDQFGVSGREVSCHTDLNLSGYSYFPANHYQSDNHVVLRAAHNINATNITVLSGADYELHAGEHIVLGPGFHVESGARFSSKIAGCNPNRERNGPSVNLNEMLAGIKLPGYKPFDAEHYLGKLPQSISVFPNPHNGNFSIQLNRMAPEDVISLDVLDINGISVLHRNKITDIRIDLSLDNIAKGLYLVKVETQSKIHTQKVSIQ